MKDILMTIFIQIVIPIVGTILAIAVPLLINRIIRKIETKLNIDISAGQEKGIIIQANRGINIAIAAGKAYFKETGKDLPGSKSLSIATDAFLKGIKYFGIDTMSIQRAQQIVESVYQQREGRDDLAVEDAVDITGAIKGLLEDLETKKADKPNPTIVSDS